MASKTEIEKITAALLRIHKANTLERRIYLAMSIISFAVLMIVSLHAYFRGEMNTTSVVSMFSATGVIGICITRILSIWRDCLGIIRAVVEKGASS